MSPFGRTSPSRFAPAMCLAVGLAATGLLGCGGTSTPNTPVDAAVAPDLTVLVDLRMVPDLTTPPDMTVPAMSGACTNTADTTVLGSIDVQKVVGDCGTSNLAAEPATLNCIKMMTGLSSACTTCFDGIIMCSISKCLAQCFSDSNSAPCVMCRAMNCDPAFTSCSGLPAN